MIKHSKVNPAPPSSDASKIDSTAWNDSHVITDPAAVSTALGIHVVTGDPNGMLLASKGDLARDTTNAKVWQNTDGGMTWIDLLRSDRGAAAPGLLYLVRTDSNGVGAGTESDMDDPADQITVPNNNVTWISMYSTSFTEPITPVNMGTGALRYKGFSPAHGPELAIGAALNELVNGHGTTPDAAHKIWLDQLSLSSSKLSDWVKTSTSGNASPLLGGSNVYGDQKARALTASSTSGRGIAGMFTMLVTNDTSDSTAAANAGTNAIAFVNDNRTDLGSQLLFVWVIPQSTLPEPFVTMARNNLIAALTGIPGLAAVYAEDIPTIDDQIHFTSIGEMVLGTRQAYAMLRLAGISPRTVTAPTVVGVSQATYNGSTHGLSGFTGASGTTIRAWPFQGSAHGDTMFLPVFMGSSGAGSPIPVPSGWTAAATQISSLDSASIGNHVLLATKACLQTDLDVNPASTGGSGFPASLTVTPGGAQFMCKPFTVRGATAFDGSATAFMHTTVDTSAVTAGGVTTSAAGRTVFILITAWGNANIANGFTVTNSNLTGLSQVFGGAYPSSSGNYLYMALWTGTFAGSGSTGNSTITPAVGTPACSSQGYTWAM